ncbi:MAG TPA: CrcB family protein [Anaeromyxobacteraceae bacterium]|nr:CrcB family protein [Anaeromyxobacteraceae bacterium]
MLPFLLVCLGGAIGSGARYLVATWAATALGTDFPRGTLIVNVAGSFLLAAVMAAALQGTGLHPNARLFLGAGVMGGFTTYSSFNLETIELMAAGSWGLAGANLLLTVAGCLVAGLAGLAVGRWAIGA